MSNTFFIGNCSIDPDTKERLLLALGRNVNRLRHEQSLTKRALAEMSGVSRPFLDGIENGTADPRLSYIQKIADALCVTPADLIGDVEGRCTGIHPLVANEGEGAKPITPSAR